MSLQLIRKKRSKKVLNLDIKSKIISRLESGESVSSVGRAFGLNESTVRSIRAQKNIIKQSFRECTLTSAKITKKVRDPIVEKLENILIEWIKDNNNRRIETDSKAIRTKAKDLYELLKNDGEASSSGRTFSASKGWYDRFKQRHKANDVKFTEDVANADEHAAQLFVNSLKHTIYWQGFIPDQIFNVDETCLYFKRLPLGKFASQEKRRSSGFNALKDRFSLLFCTNASGDFKCKPFLIYNSENPRGLKKVNKSTLPIHWRSNKMSWITPSLFEDWFKNCFCPEVTQYFKSKNITRKALLLVGNAQTHAINLQNFDEDVKVMFLPSNTTSLIQPLNQGIISTFKLYYIRLTLKQMLDFTQRCTGDNNSIRAFWKSYNIMNTVENTNTAWNEVNNVTLNDAWKNIWPECCNNSSLATLSSDSEPAIRNEILQLGKSLSGDDFVDLDLHDDKEAIEVHDFELLKEELCSQHMETLVDTRGKLENVDASNEDKLTIKNLSKVFTMADQLIEEISRIDNNFERVTSFRSTFECTLAPYKILLDDKRKEARQPKISQFFKPKRI